MKDYSSVLSDDVRFKEGLNACMNCGVCTAICPAAEFYDYDPRKICNILLSKDNEKIEELLKTDFIWYCGQCMSCKSRCPRGNVPALLISALRKISQETGLFTESEKGRQQYAIYKTVGVNMLETGYCVHLDMVDPQLHPEQGKTWEWYYNNAEEMVDKLGGNYKKEGPGALRKIPEKNLKEVRKIFEVTGATDFFKKIEKFSEEKANQLNKNTNKDDVNSEYFYTVYIENSDNHNKK